MTSRLAATVAVGLLSATIAAQTSGSWTFDADAASALPQGFTLASMRQNAAGVWTVRHEATTRYLAHTPEPSHAGGYSMAIAPSAPMRDVVVSARFRLSGGSRAGGLVWRYQDPDNFYAAVLDLSQGTLFMYLVRNGNRITVESEDDLELDPNAWHTLRIVHERASVYVSLGGIRVFEERGGRLERTLGDGRIGVLAAGDADVQVDDLKVEPGRDRR